MLSVTQQLKSTRDQCQKARAWVDRLPDDVDGKKKLLKELDDMDSLLWQLIYQEGSQLELAK